MSSANRGAERREGDFYATPAWVTRAILPFLPRRGVLLEPSAGEGAILDVVQPLWTGDIVAVELNNERWRTLDSKGYLAINGDFIAYSKRWSGEAPDLVIGNPPFTYAQEFVEAALRVVDMSGTVAMLLRLSFLEGKARAPFHVAHPSDVYVLPRRPSFTGNGTDSCAYAWFVWGPGRGCRWSILEIESGTMKVKE